MNFKLQSIYKSLDKDMEWKNIPKLAIITGKNGTGKSQLLEAMKNPINWEGDSYTKELIKYISAHHDMIHNNSKSVPLNPKEVKSNMINTFQKLTSKDFLDILKEENLTIAEVLDFIYKSKYDNKDNKVHTDNPELSSKMYKQRTIGGTQSSQIHHYVYILTSNTKIDFRNNIEMILKKTGKSKLEDLTEEEFSNAIHLDPSNNFTTLYHLKKWFEVFTDDFDRRSGKANRVGSDEDRTSLLSEPMPWELMNEILERYDFKYRIRDFDSSISPIDIKFYNDTTDTPISIDTLSSGEQQLISLVAWAHNEIIANNIKLLLLDEPDSHLHPSFCRIFVEIINDYVVKKYGIQVIMTTHSPSTIAYAPEDSIFVMNERGSEHRITKQSKNVALDILSDGLMTLNENSLNIIGDLFSNVQNTVLFVEGKTDKIHIEQCLKYDEGLRNKFQNIKIISIGGVDNYINTIEPILKQINREKEKTFILLDNDTAGKKCNKKVEESLITTITFNNENKDIEEATLLYDNREKFKEWIKKEYPNMLNYIEDRLITNPDDTTEYMKCVFAKFINKKKVTDKIPNPLRENKEKEEEASNVFKNLWCEYLKQNYDIAKDCYKELIKLLTDNRIK